MDLSWCIICDNRIVDDELSMVSALLYIYICYSKKLKTNIGCLIRLTRMIYFIVLKSVN